MDNKEPSSIPEKLYYKIGEVSGITGIEPYVLRYWESEFKIVSPSRTSSKQRLYRKKDVELILEIKKLLYEEKFTIAGAKKKLQKTRGLKEQQMKLELPEKRYREALVRVKKDLEELHGLLSRG
jgi:DNA-binding transcriptional MerR regulator